MSAAENGNRAAVTLALLGVCLSGACAPESTGAESSAIDHHVVPTPEPYAGGVPSDPACANDPIGAALDPAIGPPSAAALQQLAPQGTLRIGISTGNVDVARVAGGLLVGTAVDLACRIAAQLNLPLQLTNESATSLAPDFASGVFDIGIAAALGNAVYTQAQARAANAYLDVENTCMVPGASSVQTVSALNHAGVELAVHQGNAADRFLTAVFTNATIVRFASDDDASQALANGAVDAACSSTSVLDTWNQAHWGGQGRLLDAFFANHFAPFVPSADREAACWLSDYVEGAKSSGLIAEAIRRMQVLQSMAGVVASAAAPICAPTAKCKDVMAAADATCRASASIDDGSSDVDGDPICRASPAAPYALGTTSVTLTCNDGDRTAPSSSCSATVTVVDATPPTVTLLRDANGFSASLWPPNHELRTFSLSECIASIVDNCDGPLTIAQAATIVRVTSDEAADGHGSGHTGVDIVIRDATTVDLRAEREGGGDGRVYDILVNVADHAGNVTPITCKVEVPHDQSGAPAVDSGRAYCVGQGC